MGRDRQPNGAGLPGLCLQEERKECWSRSRRYSSPYNQEENIGRTLDRLNWASDIVVVDSFSADKTVAIARSSPQVRLFQRSFDSHAQQWNFGFKILASRRSGSSALDADYVLSDELIDELTRLRPEADISGFLAAFRYCVLGKPLGVLFIRP